MTLPFVHYLKNEVKKEVHYKIIKNEINQEDLQQFSQKDLEKAAWKDEREFSLQGKMYDLVKTEIINGKKMYYCFQDKKETKIVNLETKIQDFFSNSVYRHAQVKTFYTNSVKTNPVSKVQNISFFHLQKNNSLKSQFKSYHSSIKTSGFIEKLLIPPEV